MGIFQQFHTNSKYPLVARWSGRLGLTFVEQLVFSLANFLSQILLARWMVESEYGVFSLGFAIYLFFLSVPTALIWEPMAVLGATKTPEEQPGYLRRLLAYQCMLSTAASLLIGLFALLLPGKATAAVIGAGLSMPFLLLVWFYRQTCYYRTRPADALKVSLLYTILQIGGVFGLNALGRLTALNVFAWTAASSLVAFLAGWKSLGLHEAGLPWAAILWEKSILRPHWGYGKWILASGLAYGVITAGVLPLMSLFSTFEIVAAFKAMQNFVQPVYQGLAAVTLIILPVASRQFQRTGSSITGRELFIFLVGAAGLSGLYLLMLVFFGEDLIGLIYRSGYYSQYSWLLVWLGVAMVIHTVGQVFRILLRVMQQPRSVFFSLLYSALFVATAGVLLIRQLGVLGAAVTVTASVTIEVLILALRFRKQAEHSTIDPTVIVDG